MQILYIVFCFVLVFFSFNFLFFLMRGKKSKIRKIINFFMLHSKSLVITYGIFDWFLFHYFDPGLTIGKQKASLPTLKLNVQNLAAQPSIFTNTRTYSTKFYISLSISIFQITWKQNKVKLPNNWCVLWFNNLKQPNLEERFSPEQFLKQWEALTPLFMKL